MVWKNYLKEHAFLFEDGDVEGLVKHEVLRELKINAVPQEAQHDMTACLKWAFRLLEEALQPKR